MLVDSHCHLDYIECDGGLDDAVVRARESGVCTMVTICTKITEFAKVIRIAEKYHDVWCTVGIHPHEVEREPAVSRAELVSLAQHPKVVGIGETGLDYFYEHSPRSAQQRSFLIHIEAARETGLPLVVHTRDADPDTIEILAREQATGQFAGLIHCYSTSPQMAEKAIEMGFYISLAGILTFKRSDELRNTVTELPLDRLLVETDSPYLAPVPKRGKPNEPAFVVYTAAKLAEIRELAPADIARITTDNFYRLFSRAKRHVPG